ncbi:MAG: hypothetical protein ACTS8H_00030 [Arsenophonus sp. NC-PE1-MAG3]
MINLLRSEIWLRCILEMDACKITQECSSLLPRNESRLAKLATMEKLKQINQPS